jgi:hypothetical protein
MQMIDVLKRLAELDSTNPNVAKPTMAAEQSLATVSNIESETITESVNECGPMGMSGMGGMDRPSTPATFSINASAESGAEVSSMLRDIMNLAGVKPVADLPAFGGSKAIDLAPAQSLDAMNDGPQSAGDEMGDLIGMIDKMDSGDTDSKMGDVDGDGDHDMKDHDLEKSDSPVAKMADEVRGMTAELTGEEQGAGAGFDTATTTPDEKVKAHSYGNDQVTPKPPEPLAKAGGGNPYNESVDQVSSQLLKAYEAFKNGK